MTRGCLRHHLQMASSFCCWTRQRGRRELARRTDLIDNNKHCLTGLNLLCFPGRTGFGVLHTHGITAGSTKPVRLNRCIHTNQIEGVSAAFENCAKQRLKAAINTWSTIFGWLVNHGTGQTAYS